MNKLEASQVVEVIGSIYTNYRPMNLELAIEAWRGIFSAEPYEVVMGALYSYARSNKEFPPTPGQLNEIITQSARNGELSESEAWNMVIRALRNGYYGAEQEFAKLPEDVQKAIGSASYLQSLAASDNANMSVESSNFYRSYRTVVQRRKNKENLPEGVQAIIDKLTGDEQMQLEDKQQKAIAKERAYYEDAYLRAEGQTKPDAQRAKDEGLHPRLQRIKDEMVYGIRHDDEADGQRDDVADDGFEPIGDLQEWFA